MPIASTSALTEQSEVTGLAQQIMEVPEPVWRKISLALRVKTRQQAVQLVHADERAASMVSEIIRTSAPRESALTYSPPAESVENRLYGGGGKARLKIG